MAVAGDELRATVLDDGECAEAVLLQFEHPLGVIEGQRSARQRHWLECHANSILKTMAKVGRRRSPTL